MIRISSISVFLVSLGLASAAQAQEATRLPESAQQSLGIDAGLENALVARATYAHRLDVGALREARVYGRFVLPFAAPDFGDWAVDGGFRTNVVNVGDFRLAAFGGPVMKTTSNTLFSAVALGLGATLLLGYEGPSWGLSGEVGYEQLFTTHIHHSDMYRSMDDAGAKDGWYAFSGSTAHAGLRAGARIGAVEIVAKAGVNTTGQLGPINPPFYCTLGTSYAF